MKPAIDYTETELNEMTPKALVDIYNQLAKITGATETKRFATKADALKRVLKEKAKAKAQTIADNQKLFADADPVVVASATFNPAAALIETYAGDVDPIPAPKPVKAPKTPAKPKPVITATKAELVAATVKAVTAPKSEKATTARKTKSTGDLKPGRLAPTARKVEENLTTVAGLARSLIVKGLDDDAVLAAIRKAFAPKKIPNNAAAHYRADAKRRGMI